MYAIEAASMVTMIREPPRCMSARSVRHLAGARRARQ
jgi:hypothetical protein